MGKRTEDDGLFDLWLGFVFALGSGLCVMGIAAAVLVAFFPQYVPALVIQLMK